MWTVSAVVGVVFQTSDVDSISVIGKVPTEYKLYITKDAEVNIKHQSKHNFTLLISENNYSTSIAQNSVHFFRV
jgi:uncharacterized linocin/CFP29 family protein